MGLVSVEGLWAARQELPKAGNGRKPALWRILTGLEVGKEEELSPGERAAGLRKLVSTVTRVLRTEFKAVAAERAVRAGRDVLGGATADAGYARGTVGAGAAELDRAEDEDAVFSPCWNPVAQVCAYLSIAETMLTRLALEVSGYSAQQLADRERIRAVQPQLRAELEEFVRREIGAGYEMDYDERSMDARTMQWALFKRWKAYKAEHWRESNAARAVRFGFKYAARYRQACLLEFGVTPEGLEFEALEELATYFAACEGLKERAMAIEDPCHSYKLELAKKPYQDLWAKLWVEKKEWLLAMKERWGLARNDESRAYCEKHMEG